LIGRLRKHFVSGGDAPFPVIIVDDAHELEKESDLCSLLHDSAAASLIHGCLKKMLALDIYAAISTRIRSKMNSLSPSDSIAFIKHRLSIAQANENIFSNDAMELIAADGNGNRRSLMNLCSMAMEVACERHERVISADLVHNMHMEGV
jgi:Cdc6-like AAA superfamily ATPase